MPNTDLSTRTDELVEAFRVIAQNNGNCEAAGRELDKPGDTLRRWKRHEYDLYLKVAKRELDTIRQLTAEKHLAIAEDATDLESEVIAKVKQRLNNGSKIDTRDLTTIGRNLATEAGIHTDKASDMLGLKDRHTTAVQVNLNLGEMVKGMAAKGTKFYDAEGEEIDPQAIDSGE